MVYWIRENPAKLIVIALWAKRVAIPVSAKELPRAQLVHQAVLPPARAMWTATSVTCASMESAAEEHVMTTWIAAADVAKMGNVGWRIHATNARGTTIVQMANSVSVSPVGHANVSVISVATEPWEEVKNVKLIAIAAYKVVISVTDVSANLSQTFVEMELPKYLSSVTMEISSRMMVAVVAA